MQLSSALEYTLKTRAAETPMMKRKAGMTKSATVTPNHGAWFIPGHAPPASSTSIIICASANTHAYTTNHNSHENSTRGNQTGRRRLGFCTHGDSEAAEHVKRGHPLRLLLLGLRIRPRRLLRRKGFEVGLDLVGRGE